MLCYETTGLWKEKTLSARHWQHGMYIHPSLGQQAATNKLASPLLSLQLRTRSSFLRFLRTVVASDSCVWTWPHGLWWLHGLTGVHWHRSRGSRRLWHSGGSRWFMSSPSQDLAQGELVRETHATQLTFSLALRCYSQTAWWEKSVTESSEDSKLFTKLQCKSECMSERCPAYIPHWANSCDLMSLLPHHRTAWTLGGGGVNPGFTNYVML